MNSNEAFNQIESPSLRQCMDKCDTADATVNACNSIVIHRNSQISNRCQLHDVAVGENNVTSTSSETSQYFNKPHWYRGVQVYDGFYSEFHLSCNHVHVFVYLSVILLHTTQILEAWKSLLLLKAYLMVSNIRDLKS